MKNILRKNIKNKIDKELSLLLDLLPAYGIGLVLGSSVSKFTYPIVKYKESHKEHFSIDDLSAFFDLTIDAYQKDKKNESLVYTEFIEEIGTVYGKSIIQNKEIVGVIYLLLDQSVELNERDIQLFLVFHENIENKFKITTAKDKNNPSSIRFNDQFKFIFDFVPEAISFHELPSHKTIAVNRAFIDYSGFSEEEIAGKTGVELNLWYNEEERLKYREILAKKKIITNYEAQFVNNYGHVFYGLISSKIVELSQKRYLLVVIRNIDQIKKAQEDIKESERKFKMLFNSVPENLSINRISDNKFVEVNDYFVKNSGYSRDEIIGKTGFELNMWANIEEREEFQKQVKEVGGVIDFRYLFQHKDGHVLHAIISATTITLNDEPHLFVVTKNINDLIITKNALKSSEEKFKMIFQSSPDAININRYEDAVFVDVNDSFLRETGYKRDELIGKPISDFVFWKNEDDLAEFIRQLNDVGSVHNMETKYITRHGEVVNSLVSASISIINGEPHIVTITRNINELKQVQQVLKQSENRFRTIVEKSHAAIFIIDNDYRLVYTNPRSSELFGYSKNELQNKDIRSIIHPDSMSLVLNNYVRRQQMKEVSEQYEFQIVTKDGQIRDVEIRSSVYIDIQGNIRTIAQLLDITDIKKANAEALEQATKAQNYLDISAVFMLALDKKGKIIMVNRKACQILEYSEQELLGLDWFDNFIAPGLKESTKEVFVQAIAGKESMGYFENKIRSKSGKISTIAWYNTLLYDKNGQITGTLSSGEDITEEMKHYELLRESENRYRTIFDSNLDGMAIFDENGRIIEVNEVVTELYGYSYEELINRNSSNEFSIVSGYDIETIKKYLKKNNVFQTELEDTRKDGSVFVINAKIREIVYNNTTHYLVIIRDISEKKDAELELIKAKEKAIESDQLKSAFLANMSHEIRTPMNAIIGFSGLLEEDHLDDAERKDFIARIKNNSTALLGLINDIIDISKIEANQVVLQNFPFNLNQFFVDLEQVFELHAEEKNINLFAVINSPKDEYIFYSDENRLRQIMINLLSNALKFTPENGTVEFGYTIRKKHITFFVKDTGIGISKANQKLVFSRFRQASIANVSKYGGTGLGLSISKGLVDIMGGQMWLESKLNKGSTFYFSLPVRKKS